MSVPNRVLVIAEAGIGHGGKLSAAKEMADIAKLAGADIVKYQMYHTENLIRPDHPEFDTLKALELAPDDWLKLVDHCKNIGIEFLATPGDLYCLTTLVGLGVKRIKIGSDDLTNHSLISAAHKSGLPLILSTGMATGQEIAEATAHINNFSLLHCVSLYPCNWRYANLRSIQYLKNCFSCNVGYSDHTADPTVVMLAVAAGADIIEVHFKRTASEKPIDDAVSFTPLEFRQLIGKIRAVETMMGHYDKKPCALELEVVNKLRKGPDGLRAAE